MSRWFRVYDDLVDDPKVQRLSAENFRALVNLWCLTSRNGGTLPPADDIAFSLRMRPDKVAALLAGLRNAGLLDDEMTENGNVTRPHNWQRRQFKSDVSTGRVKRHRERQGNVSSTVSETPPDTETDTETDSSSLRSDETRETALAVRQPDAEPPVAPDDFPELPAILERRATAAVDRTRETDAEFDERFWPAYPHKVGKPDARKAFRRARKAHPLAAILFGLDRYIAEKPGERPWLNPATFLNQERFNDQPASTENRASASPHDAILGAVARQFAPRDDPDRGKAGAGGGLFDEPGDDPGNRGGTVELGQGDYRRTA